VGDPAPDPRQRGLARGDARGAAGPGRHGVRREPGRAGVFLLGRFDRHVDAKLAAAYLEALRAPAKRLVWFERSAHNVPFEEPERFDQTVVAELRALGIGAEGR
jgi:pimeloyl-ACP methyl ester carboxylesterase